MIVLAAALLWQSVTVMQEFIPYPRYLHLLNNLMFNHFIVISDLLIILVLGSTVISMMMTVFYL